MTRDEWLVSTNPEAMLWFLRGTASNRKLRLYALAWANHRFTQMEDERSRFAVEVAERYVEGVASKSELVAAFRDAQEVCEEIHRNGGAKGRASRWGRSNRGAQQALGAAASAKNASDPAWDARQALRSARIGAATESGVQRSNLLRDIFNPFLLGSPDTTLLTTTVVSLAQAIYDERTFDGLPILADALEEAGCTDADVLGHCRNEGPHVRGCWVVDLVLDKG